MTASLPDLTALPDTDAVRLLALVADYASALPDLAHQRRTADRLGEAAADVTADFGDAVTDGDLARAALAYLATTPEGTPALSAAAAIPAGTTRFDPTGLLVGALVVAVLQTDVDLTRDRDGRWKLHIRKHAMRDSTLAALVAKLLSYYRQNRP
ncbi:hypothetical protein ABT369_44830 [Dactylosporangium sp. NPDC000244]|uniref:hypothetical protein n=1 Tax=Dactylosporangium sp. NPDC000244 TaxID=3154365 RepID=UPI003322D65F